MFFFSSLSSPNITSFNHFPFMTMTKKYKKESSYITACCDRLSLTSFHLLPLIYRRQHRQLNVIVNGGAIISTNTLRVTAARGIIASIQQQIIRSPVAQIVFGII